MRRQTARAVLALGAIVAALGIVGPARAADPQWERIACDSGTIEVAEVEATESGDYLTLAGHLDCADPAGTAAYGFAVYGRDASAGVVYEHRLRPYADQAPSLFRERNLLSHPPVASLLICVVTDYKVRIACVAVDWNSADQAYEVRSLSIDDPVVDGAVRVIPNEMSPSPVCGTCW